MLYGGTSAKRAITHLKNKEANTPHFVSGFKRRQLQNVLCYQRRKVTGTGTQLENVIEFLKHPQMQKNIFYPTEEKDYPTSAGNWGILLSSKQLIDGVGQYHEDRLFGFDSVYKLNRYNEF